jgi:hypothetical protein
MNKMEGAPMSFKVRVAIFCLGSIFASVAAAVESAKESPEGMVRNAPDASSPRMPSTIPNRSIYVNGVDISSARNHDMRNVQVKISDNGDIYISAPQYQVIEEETFMPLSAYSAKGTTPVHRAAQELTGANGQTTAKASPESAAAAPAAPAAPTAPASAIPPKTGG